MIAAPGWRLRQVAKSAPALSPTELDAALLLAADLAGASCEENMKGWREALFTEARRRLPAETGGETARV